MSDIIPPEKVSTGAWNAIRARYPQLLNKTNLADEIEKKPLEEEYFEGEINWLEEMSLCDTWDKVKGKCKLMWGHKRAYDGKPTKWFLIAHSQDKIKGKPQLIDNVQKRIPLVRKVITLLQDRELESKGKVEIQSFFFLDERFDKRHDGFQNDSFALNFWTYRIIDDSGLEYYVLSQKKLPNETCNCKGMLIEFDDITELSRSMKIKSLSRVFILKDFEPSVKILTKEQIVKWAKERQITEKDWLDFLSYHKLGTQNRFPEEVELLRSAQILSGKHYGWPLHLGIVGRTGTRKSMGHIETIAYKFEEEPQIIEGANSRIKGLSPSFKEKPANLGYLAITERMGWIDEIGKMVEFELNKHQTNVDNVLGELNFLLEHKQRLVGSGNDNQCDVQATAKFTFVSNPVGNKETLGAHVGVIDPTFMSRLMWWVQDEEEIKFVTSEKGVVKVPPTPTQAHIDKNHIQNTKNLLLLKQCWGKVSSREEFLTLFDTCYSFLSDIDEERVKSLANEITMLAKEPMKSVWSPRAVHHVILLIDGLCKHRCLFKDYDNSFVAKEEDYDRAERILIRMVRGWDTKLNVRGWGGSL